MTKVIFSVI